MSAVTFTSSSTSTYLTCPRKYEWAYKNKIRPEHRSEALRVGSGFHKAIEMLTDGLAWEQVVNDTIRDCVDEHEAHMVLAMATAHAHRWQHEQLEQISVEEKWSKTLGGVDCRGMIDGTVRLPDGRSAVHEYKTTSQDIEPGAVYWRRLKMNVQVAMYQMASEADTVIYDVIKKPTIRPKQVPLLDADGNKIVLDDETGERVENKNGTWKQSATKGCSLSTRLETPEEFGMRCYEQLTGDPDKFFARIECPRVEGDLLAAIEDLRHVERLVSLDIYPRNTNACATYGKCEYFELCNSNMKPADGVPAGFVQLQSAHPELDGNDISTD